MMYRARISGTGAALPDRIMTNFDLEKLVDTSDEWIVQRTGIRERRILADGESTGDLAIGAGRRALEAAALAPTDIDTVVVATLSPDNPAPALAVTVQNALGIPSAGSFDLNAACTGFVYGVATAASFVESGLSRHVLLVGAEGLSRFVDFTDRNTCILFGDGAGAAVISRAEEGEGEIVDSSLRADGSQADLIEIPAGGARCPASPETLESRGHYLKLKGREVFKFATKAMVELVRDATSKNGLSPADIDVVVPHQVNYRIIEAALKKLDIPEERVFLNLDRYGNTSAASVPIALDEAVREGKIRSGNTVLCVAFGAGMTWGYNLIRW